MAFFSFFANSSKGLINGNKTESFKLSWPVKRVTSLSKELNKKVSEKEVIKNLKKGFKEYFKIEFEEADLKQEKKLIQEIQKKIFENKKWIYER